MTARRSTTVKLTLLPMLASAAVASAQAPGETPPLRDGALPAPDPDRELSPQEMQLQPPGMTPTVDQIDCDDPLLPYWEYALVCEDMTIDADDEVVVRGGFGSYFWTGGG